MSNELDKLKTIGFQHIGKWVCTESGINFNLEEHGKSTHALYAFALNNTVLYVGKTISEIHKRMSGYKNPGHSQKTNIKVKGKILEILESNPCVDIYAMPDNKLLFFGGFHVNLSAGLEDSIIKEGS